MTVSATTDFSVVLNNLKQTYAKDLEDNRPMFTVLQELLPPNRDGIEVGDKLNIPILLTHQGGESYGTSGDTSNLRQPVSIEIRDAQTDQFEITQPVRMPFGLISKVGQSKSARFADKARLILLSGDTGAKRSLEMALLHGANGLGQVSALGAVLGAGPWTRTVTFTAASWSDGIWGAVDNLPFDMYSALTAGTKRNLIGDLTLSAVNFPTKTVTFTALGASTDLSTIVANDFVFPASAYGKQMPGLQNILGTTTGNLLAVSTNYTMWSAKQVTVTGPITFGKLLSGISPAVSHGANGKLTVLASPRNWADLMKDLASGRRLDASYSRQVLTNGAKKLAFSYENGDLDIVLHPFFKDGEISVIPLDNWFRAGSDPDPTMRLGDIPLQVMSSSANTFEFRFWSASAIIPNILGTSVLFSGITPNAN